MYVGFCDSDSSKLTKLTGEEAQKLLLCSTIGEEVETIGCERSKISGATVLSSLKELSVISGGSSENIALLGDAGTELKKLP